MKKFFLAMVAMLCVATASAQDKWSVGLRLGSGAQVESEFFYSDKAYLEGLLGLSLFDNLLDFSLIHNWNCCQWNWTPNAGDWFLDAGVGGRVGGNGDCCFFGVAGQVKFGIEFNRVPIRLALDVTPSFGPVITYGKTVEGVKVKSHTGFYNDGILSFGLSATWRF